IVDYCPAGCR
nr:RecName: Full=Blight-associated protein p12 [Cycas revoluta]